MSKGNLVLLVALGSLFFAGAFTTALASDNISVDHIAPVYVERGVQNCLVTIKAHVTNNGESGNVNVEVVGVDADGYQLQTIKLTGKIDGGATKVLLERVKMSTKSYDQVVNWQLLR